MGVRSIKNNPPVLKLAHCAKSIPDRVKSINTDKFEDMLSIGRPMWMKVQERECRLAWLTEMVKKELIAIRRNLTQN